MIQPLRQTDGVGDRHQNDFTLNLALPLRTLQQCSQVVGRQHAGQFFSVQAGLNVGFGPGAGRAEMQAGQGFLAAQTLRQEGVVNALHGNQFLRGAR